MKTSIDPNTPQHWRTVGSSPAASLRLGGGRLRIRRRSLGASLGHSLCLCDRFGFGDRDATAAGLQPNRFLTP